MASTVEASGQVHQQDQSPANMTVEDELFQASDKLIAELNKQGVTQGRKDIAKPKRRHPPILISMEEYEDYLASAKSYVVDKRFKRRDEEDEEYRHVGKKINVVDIFKDVTTRDGRLKKCMHVLFSGAAGMGKTTLLRSIAQDAREGKIEALKDKLILMPDFRTFSSEEKIFPSQALLGNMFSDHGSERMEQRYQWILENSDNVAFLVDSLDTLPFDLENERPRIGHQEKAPIDSILHNLLSQDLFPKSILISSSREFKVRNLHPSVRPDRFVLLDGLSTDSVNELIDDFLGKKKGLEVKEHIATKCPAIGPLLTIPVFFVLYVIGCVSGVLIPETMSGILVTFFLALGNSPHVDAETFQVVLKKLLPLAFEGTRSGKVLFTPEHMKRFGLTPKEASALGILIPQSQGTYLASKLMQNDCFFLYFNHQTQQECLSALSVLSRSTDEFKVFITGDFNGENFIVVRRFVCGVLLNDEVLEGAMKLTTIQDVKQKRTILLGNLKTTFNAVSHDKAKLLEFFIDLNECKNGVTELIQSLVRKIEFRDFKLSLSDIQAISTLMKQCKYLGNVDLNNCNLNEQKMGILSKTLMQSKLRLKKLYVNSNKSIGSGGMFHLGKFVQNSKLEELYACQCALKSEHLEKFAEGAGKAKLKKLDVSGNESIGSGGMFHLGKFVQKSKLEVLDASQCALESEHLEKFAEGAGNAEIDSLDLSDAWYKPLYTRSLLKLLKHVRKQLNLGFWKINERQQEEIQNELNLIGSPTLTVTIKAWGGGIHLKASQVESTSDGSEEPSTSEAVIVESSTSEVEPASGAVSIAHDYMKIPMGMAEEPSTCEIIPATSGISEMKPALEVVSFTQHDTKTAAEASEKSSTSEAVIVESSTSEVEPAPGAVSIVHDHMKIPMGMAEEPSTCEIIPVTSGISEMEPGSGATSFVQHDTIIHTDVAGQPSTPGSVCTSSITSESEPASGAVSILTDDVRTASGVVSAVDVLTHEAQDSSTCYKEMEETFEPSKDIATPTTQFQTPTCPLVVVHQTGSDHLDTSPRTTQESEIACMKTGEPQIAELHPGSELPADPSAGGTSATEQNATEYSKGTSATKQNAAEYSEGTSETEQNASEYSAKAEGLRQADSASEIDEFEYGFTPVIKKNTIAVSGGELSIENYKIEFPENSVSENMEMAMALEMDFREVQIPQHVVPVSAMIGVSYQGILKKLASFSIPTWFVPADPSDQIMIFKSKPRKCETDPLAFEHEFDTIWRDGKVVFKSDHFCKRVAAVDGKKINYGSLCLAHALLHNSCSFKVVVCYLEPAELLEKKIEHFRKDGYKKIYDSYFELNVEKFDVMLQSLETSSYKFHPEIKKVQRAELLRSKISENNPLKIAIDKNFVLMPPPKQSTVYLEYTMDGEEPEPFAPEVRPNFQSQQPIFHNVIQNQQSGSQTGITQDNRGATANQILGPGAEDHSIQHNTSNRAASGDKAVQQTMMEN